MIIETSYIVWILDLLQHIINFIILQIIYRILFQDATQVGTISAMFIFIKKTQSYINNRLNTSCKIYIANFSFSSLRIKC